MDLLSSRPLREGSRGGRNEFSWDSVKNDKDRENYLGHSLMAPVGRWQQGKDLTWYAKDGTPASADAERQKRLEEIRKIKEIEEDALSAALGLPVTIRRPAEERVTQDDIRRAVGDVGEPEVEGKGIGFGKMGDSIPYGRGSGGEWEQDEEEGKLEGYNLKAARDGPNDRPIPRERSRERSKRDRRKGDKSEGLRDFDRGGPHDRRHRSGRDRSRSRDNHRHRDRSKHREHHNDEGKYSARRHRDRKSQSPPRRHRSRSRSRSRSDRNRVRDRDGGKRRDRPEDPDRAAGKDDRGHRRRH
ncbi:kinase phosphorylation protein-domain-containing protein [Peziza echinospora]|nr:kinase phosphorylation protein-domain-containing protein [Peziza echinospora]